MSKVRSLVSNDIDLLDRAGDQLIAKLQMQAASLYDVYPRISDLIWTSRPPRGLQHLY